MAQLIMTTSQLKLLIERVTPAVEEWSADVAKRREQEYTEYNRALEQAKQIPSNEVLKQRAHEMKVKLDGERKWYQSSPCLVDLFEKEVDEAHREALWAVQAVREGFIFRHREEDHIIPVLNYLTALIERLDPEAKIALTDKETFQMKKAMEIAGVNDPRA